MGFKVKSPAATAAPPKEEAAAKPAAAKKVVAKKAPEKVAPEPAPTPDVAETVAAPKTAEQLAAEAAAKAPEAGGIVTPRMRSAVKPAAEAGLDDTTAKAEEPSENLEDWTHSGEDAAAMAAAIAAKREQEREDRRKRGYFPNKFELIPPSMDYPNRYQADIIVLDVKMGPALNLHVLKNPRSGRYDVNEPCPKEWDNCPICPPHGERDSVFVALLSVLNLNGYTNQKTGDFVPVTKELLVIPSAEQAFFHALARERGEAGLRGLQLTMNRNDRNVSRIGIPSDPRWHTEEALAKFLQENGMWKERRTRPSNEFPEGEVIGPEDWMMHAFTYSDFLHKPSGADLRKRYQNGGAPIGAAASGGDASQWGQGRYEPGAAAAPGGANFAADLDDDVPF